MEDVDRINQLRGMCWDRALESYGTAFIYEQRALRLRRQLRILTYLGMVVPGAVGLVVLSFGNPSFLPIVLIVAGILGLVQFLGSVWSVVSRWDDSYAYALESVTSNYYLSDKYRELGEDPPSDLSAFETRLASLEKVDRPRRDADYRQGVTKEEKRMGMRAGLHKFQRECAQCGKAPPSMEPSGCDVCGNFKRRIL